MREQVGAPVAAGGVVIDLTVDPPVRVPAPVAAVPRRGRHVAARPRRQVGERVAVGLAVGVAVAGFVALVNLLVTL